MFMTAGVPCCCLQIYVSLERIEGDRINKLFATRGDQQWFVQNLFSWIGCLMHCVFINGFFGFVYATVIFLVMLCLWPLLWAAQQRREQMLRGKPPGCQLEEDDIVAEVGKTAATLFFSYYNVFQAWGCVGSSYHTPTECTSPIFAQLMVVSEVSLLSIMEFIAVRGGYYSYFEVMTFQVDNVDLTIMALCALTILLGTFVFSTSNVDGLYYEEKDDGSNGLTLVGTSIFLSHTVLWLVITSLCRVSHHRRKIEEAENGDSGDRGEEDAEAARQEEVMLVPTTKA